MNSLPPACFGRLSPSVSKAVAPGAFYSGQALIAFGLVPARQKALDLLQFAGFKQVQLRHGFPLQLI
jgi:hypothetical protein